MLIVRITAAAIAGVVLCVSGCTSMNPVVRAQSPVAPEGEIQQVAHVQKRDKIVRPLEAMGAHKTYGVMTHPVYDATLGQISRTSKTYHSYAGDGAYYGGGACPNGNCPPSYGGYSSCPDGRCGRGGCRHPICIRDSRSYNYKQPNDLRYPADNVIGGVIVYPYYTHKGPSDFFRK